jgi:hypothetical protein
VLQVVGEAGSEHFRVHFGQAAQVELAHPQFVFDPGVAELDHSVAGDINSAPPGGHFLTKSDHGLGFPRAQSDADFPGSIAASVRGPGELRSIEPLAVRLALLLGKAQGEQQKC